MIKCMYMYMYIYICWLDDDDDDDLNPRIRVHFFEFDLCLFVVSRASKRHCFISVGRAWNNRSTAACIY